MLFKFLFYFFKYYKPNATNTINELTIVVLNLFYYNFFCNNG